MSLRSIKSLCQAICHVCCVQHTYGSTYWNISLSLLCIGCLIFIILLYNHAVVTTQLSRQKWDFVDMCHFPIWLYLFLDLTSTVRNASRVIQFASLCHCGLISFRLEFQLCRRRSLIQRTPFGGTPASHWRQSNTGSWNSCSDMAVVEGSGQ
jgi:hypothetical protein